VLLPDLLAAYRERCSTTATSSAPRSRRAAPIERRARAISSGLARLTGRTVTLATKIDPAIIGGVVARIGSTVYDGSVTRQLEK
jgi:F-type H+-transporting ATPase subunit delta